MISNKFNLLVLIMMGLIIFDVIEYGLTDDTEEDVQKANADELETRKKCQDELTTFGFKGNMFYDLQEHVIPQDKITNTIRNYIKCAGFVMDGITATNTNLISFCCDRIDPLMRQHFYGRHNMDLNNTSKGCGILKEDGDNYLNFINNQKTLELFIKLSTPFMEANLLYLYTEENKWLNIPVDNSECKRKLKELGYSGALKNYYKELNDRAEKTKDQAENTEGYEKDFLKYMDYLIKHVSNSNKDVVDLYCEIVDVLEKKNFTGEIIKDDEHANSIEIDKSIENLMYGYKYFLKQYLSNTGFHSMNFLYGYTIERMKLRCSKVY